ncbi:SOS-induced cell division inhibitor SulA [Ectopseudomonas mendocina]|uniref:SOS-induced cell division inhibitor SulA n=1 Tax=Ectopseudomonas mendocina TaxID=300 RepID=A0ABZ2RB55_ECTME
MQFPQSLNRSQLPLFDGVIASSATPWLADSIDQAPALDEDATAFSEMSLRGSAGHCLTLLAPILKALSDNHDHRWLTLIAPPATLTHSWLRESGLNRERILLLQPRGGQSALTLAEEALKLGRSHTVVSWLHPLPAQARNTLEQAAQAGKAQSLNISLG